MTSKAKISAIKTLLENRLPDLLDDAGLDDFDEYLDKSTIKSTDNEIAVYIDFESDSGEIATFSAIIQVQLHKKDEIADYHDIIYPFLQKYLTGAVVDMMQRESLDADIYPLDRNGSNSFAFYAVSFTSVIDDCFYDDFDDDDDESGSA